MDATFFIRQYERWSDVKSRDKATLVNTNLLIRVHDGVLTSITSIVTMEPLYERYGATIFCTWVDFVNEIHRG